MQLLVRHAIATTLALALSGCADDPIGTSVVVESDTRWSGTFIGANVQRLDTNGNFHLRTGNGTVCWELTKLTRKGFLRTFVVNGQTVTGPGRRAETMVTDSGATAHGCNR